MFKAGGKNKSVTADAGELPRLRLTLEMSDEPAQGEEGVEVLWASTRVRRRWLWRFNRRVRRLIRSSSTLTHRSISDADRLAAEVWRAGAGTLVAPSIYSMDVARSAAERVEFAVLNAKRASVCLDVVPVQNRPGRCENAGRVQPPDGVRALAGTLPYGVGVACYQRAAQRVEGGSGAPENRLHAGARSGAVTAWVRPDLKRAMARLENASAGCARWRRP